MSAPLEIDRRLAIQLLHEAQVASPAVIRGVVLAKGDVPWCFRTEAGEGAVWAEVLSVPLAPAEPRDEELPASHRLLLISLNTKGVLEMRAWQRLQGERRELAIRIRD